MATAFAGRWSAPVLAQTGPCTPPVVNPIPCENTQPGNPASEWNVAGDGDASIQGFATDISVNKGQTVSFKVDTTAADYRLDIYRLGYYGGSGARKIATVQPSATLPQSQPACLTQAATGLVDCGNWAVSASWVVPAGTVSGIYLAKLVREAGAAGSSHIAFVVRDDEGRSDLLFQTADTTWQAYNSYGGNSLYVGSPAGRAYKVSYNRPFNTRAVAPEDWIFNAEYPMVRWLEANGYHVSYSTGVDTDRRGAELLEHKVFLSVGHDEYWSGAQRANVEAARAAGVHLAFFSGNEVYWKVRWENSIDPSGTPYRTLVCYKETEAGAKIDPNAAWTGTWRDPRFSPPSDGGRPENALTGTIFTVNGERTDSIQVPAAYGNLRLWRNTTVATLPVGGVATFPAGTLGYEWDEDLDNGARPPGLIQHSSTTVNVAGKLQDYGTTYAAGAATHALTLYRHSSGALVFGAGTVQWSWGLDSSHDRGSAAADVRMRQATVNLFADMGAQPATLQSGLVAATATTDTTAPTSVISAPAAGATLPVGTAVTISGTASDVGGVVGAVEVSVDGGTSWRRASGRTSWSLSWTPTASSTVTIKSRAVDDSGRLETPGAGVTVTVGTGGGGGSCPCSLFSTLTPAVPTDPDTNATELGLKFQANVSGNITAIRFYKGPQNTGAHTVSLWNLAGTRLATATVTGESAEGWQQMAFASPVAITANTTYIASYFAPIGRYSVTENALTNAITNGPLTALADVASGGNGVYVYGASALPNLSFNASNFFVDVVFSQDTGPDTTAPVISAVQVGSAGATGATITWTTNEASDTQVEYGTTTAYGSSTTLNTAMVTSHSAAITGLTAGTLYNYRVKSKDAAGNLATSANGTFTTTAPDNTLPVISAVQAGSLTMTGATITWTTNETSDTQVEYGTTTAYGSFTTLNTAMVTSHSAAITGLAAGTQYNYRVLSRDPSGNLATSTNNTFVTASAPACPCSIFSPTATPAIAAENDASAVELGVKFQANVSGFITAIRFYKGTGNGGTHTISLWNTAGTRLATATVTGETATGWQQMAFASPVAVTAGTTYVASYRAPQGRYAKTENGLTTAVVNGPLTALASAASGGNGVYRYGASAYPDQTWNATNYWVDVVFTQSTGPDTTPPVISAVQAGNITGTGVTITWTTNEASDTQVEYGTTTAYGSSTTLNTAMVTSHSAAITGLTAGTLYNYRVKSRDAAGILATSANGTFTTTAPDTTPPVISAVQAGSITATGATVTWTTNEASDTQVEYGTTTSYGSQTTLNIAMVTSHSAAVTGLTAGTLYNYRVLSRDAAGILATSANSTFTTTAPDTTPPVISAVQAGSLTMTGATITWTTNEASDTQVAYGTTTGYGSTTTLISALVTSHSVAVSGLTAGTLYHYRVLSRDAAGNLAESPDATFTTAPPDTTAPVISGVQAGSITMTGATISWTTDEASDTQVEYGTTTSYGTSTTLNTAMITSHTATISGLNAGTLYNYRVKSRDAAGILATSANGTFTTAAGPTCPCSLFPTLTPAILTDPDTNATEVGLKFQANISGFITAIRFYKGPQNTGTHTVSLWNLAATRLATATVTGESAGGWQQMAFASPVAITANTTYIASYHSPNGRYSVTENALTNAIVTGPLTALADGASGGNGLYRYGASAFPNLNYLASNFFVDVVFFATADTVAPTVSAVLPTNGATGVSGTANLTATFSEPVNPNTVSTASFELRDPAGALVPAAVSYDAATRTATLNPTASLRGGLSYTATVKGGAATPQVRDDWGNALASSHVWSFTAAPPADSGPGGPVLVVTTEATPFGRYLGEILQAEGLNAYTATDITLVTAARLTGYDVVIVGEMALSAAQVTMFSDWVTAGGNLVVMRPDKKLAGLLGLTDAGASLSEGYLLVNTAAAPGTGIVSETIQYHGTADRYTLSGATAVATLYSNPTTATTSPAVTLRGVGTAGGQAAAFTYDLARSIVYTRQGNPAWAGQDRDAVVPIRSNDLFFGARSGDVQPDWVNLNKVAIPQADEQQRLLLNLISEMNRDKKPLPRFWYLPRGEKAVVVMTGDDHANGGTNARFNQNRTASPVGCSVANWDCIRSTSYIYTATPLTNAQAATAVADGFEVSIHIESGCDNYTAASLAADYSAQLAAFRAKYTSIPSPATHRLHCLVWSDWVSQARVEFDNGIRLDTNYYFYPGSWIANRPGFMTGSGMPMRFADVDGTIIDVFQAATQMTDESGQTYPLTINALLDKAIGAEGYYGVFTANMHTDVAASAGSDAIVNSAKARSVPVVSAKQMLTWLDGRNSSTFGGVTWAGNQLSFTITANATANGLQSMLPVASATGSLISLTSGGNAVPYTTQLIKGVQYAVFTATTGNYLATYSAPAVALPATETAYTLPASDALAGRAAAATLAWSSSGSTAALASMTGAGSVVWSGSSTAAGARGRRGRRRADTGARPSSISTRRR